MGFLQRSKSAGVTDHRSRSKESRPPMPTTTTTTQAAGTAIEAEKRSTSHERPKTSTSFSRPRTANAAIGRTTDWSQQPSFKIDIKAENELFSFPMPSPLLQPQPRATGKRIPSPLQELGSPAIGVAIGSPSQTRPAYSRSVRADHVSPRMPATQQPPPARLPPAIPSHPDFDMEWTDPRKRKSTWKSLGGIFCRRNTFVPAEEPLCRLKMPNAIEERDVIVPDLAELPERGTTPSYSHRRTPSLTRGQARFEARAEADKAALMPDGQTKILRSPSEIQKESFSPMFRSINGIPEGEPWAEDPRKDSPLSMMSSHSFRAEPPTVTMSKALIVLDAPHLDLDLPDPKFERYSVMFEKLLDTTSPSSSSTSTGPSLLERRQSRLQRNHSVKKLDLSPTTTTTPAVPRLEINGIPQRSTTSPALSKSLSLSARINTALSPVVEAFTALNRPRPVRRSKTAPSATTSPLRQRFANPRIEAPSPPLASATLTDYSDFPLTPMTFTTMSDGGSVIEVVGLEDLEAARRSLDAAEPGWDMLTSSPGASRGGEEDEPAPLRVRKRAAVVDTEEREARPLVQVSVAKQISVVGGNGNSGSAGGGKAKPSQRDLGEGGISGSGNTRPLMRARMIELSKNRTSTAVLIEIAEE